MNALNRKEYKFFKGVLIETYLGSNYCYVITNKELGKKRTFDSYRKATNWINKVERVSIQSNIGFITVLNRLGL